MAQELLLCNGGGGLTASQLDLPSVTSLSVAVFGRLQLGVRNWGTSEALLQVVDNLSDKQNNACGYSTFKISLVPETLVSGC